MNTTNHTSPIGEDAAAVVHPRYIVIGYGESDHPQAAFVNERSALLDAVLGMIYMQPTDTPDDEREAYRKDIDNEDEWSCDGIWRTEFEIGGITIYDLGEPVRQSASAQPIGEDAANGVIGEREAFEAWNDTQDALEFEDAEAEAHALFIFRAGWKARAALTAEKVAAEPVAVPERLPGEKFSEWAKRTYEAQPAQPAQAATLSDAALFRWLIGHCWEFKTILDKKGEPAAIKATFKTTTAAGANMAAWVRVRTAKFISDAAKGGGHD